MQQEAIMDGGTRAPRAVRIFEKLWIVSILLAVAIAWQIHTSPVFQAMEIGYVLLSGAVILWFLALVFMVSWMRSRIAKWLLVLSFIVSVDASLGDFIPAVELGYRAVLQEATMLRAWIFVKFIIQFAGLCFLFTRDGRDWLNGE